MFFMTKIHILGVKNVLIVKCKFFFLYYCITGSISFNLIQDTPIFVHSYHVFHKKISKKTTNYPKKPDFYDAHVMRNHFIFFSGFSLVSRKSLDRLGL